MRDDRRVVGHHQQTYDKRDERTLHHPVGCHHTLGRYLHLGIEEPHAHSLNGQDDHHGHGYLHLYRHAEHSPQRLIITLAQGEGEVTTDGGRHGCSQQREHADHTTHYIVGTIVLHTQHVQNNAARIKTHQHHHEHADVHDERVFCDALGVVGCCQNL